MLVETNYNYRNFASKVRLTHTNSALLSVCTLNIIAKRRGVIYATKLNVVYIGDDEDEISVLIVKVKRQMIWIKEKDHGRHEIFLRTDSFYFGRFPKYDDRLLSISFFARAPLCIPKPASKI